MSEYGQTARAPSAIKNVVKLDPLILYRAVESRDRRFEGRFVIGVVTTGVYCRPGCPARIPKRENVRFYACGPAAEDAGFRPCLRCRPEASSGAPLLLGTGATVARALRLIDGGSLDGAGVPDLADRLGVGERHLRRLFAEHLGTSPLSVARSRRVHFAKKLIDETTLPMTEIAASSGFSSIRRFNAELSALYGESPRTIRRAHGESSGRSGEIVLRLAYRSPYDWAAIAGFLGARATPGIESFSGKWYRRSVAIDGAVGVIAIAPQSGKSFLELRADASLSRVLFRVALRAGRVFDVRADPSAIAEHLGRDRRLARAVAKRPGLRVPGAWDPFELAVRAILGQQVSVKGATTLAGRLVRAFGAPLAKPDGNLTHVYPTPAALAKADVASIGLPRARAETIRRLAAAVASGELPLDETIGEDDARARLATIPGIGAWTIEYIAMRAFAAPDAFPSSDLGIRRALAQGESMPHAAEVERIAEAWRPWRAYAAMHLWMRDAID